MAFTNAEILQATSLALMRYSRFGSEATGKVLYSNGDQHADITGGWATPVKGRSFWENNYINAIFNADNIELNQTNLIGSSDIYNCGVRTINTINTTNYGYICLNVYSETAQSSCNYVQISPSTQWDYSSDVSLPLPAGMNTIKIPLSKFTGRTGADYIRINLITDTYDGHTYPPYHKTKIYKVWLE